MYPNDNDCDSDDQQKIEMALQIISGARDTWTLTDAECDWLGFYGNDRSPEGYEKLRTHPTHAKLAACSLVAGKFADLVWYIERHAVPYHD